MNNEDSEKKEWLDPPIHGAFGMTQYPPPQHIVPGGPELGYLQSDDLWTPQQVEQWKKNWLSDARPEPEVKTIGDSSDTQIKIHMLTNFISQKYGIYVKWNSEHCIWETISDQKGIQQRILNNGDKLI